MGFEWSDRLAESDVALIRPVKKMQFCSLHHHSTFSYLDGYGLPEAHVRRCAELGITHLAMTDHGNVSSHVQLEKAGNEYGVGTVFGCELYCGEVEPETRTRRKNHLTVLASSAEGYRNLLRIVSLGFSEGFYSEPTVSGKMLGEHSEGLIVLSGCQGSLLATSLVGGKNVPDEEASYLRGKRVAQRMRDSLGDAYYLEVQAFPELEKTVNINRQIARLSKELKIPLVATLDAHYTTPEEGEVQAILHNLRPGKKQTMEEQMQSWGYDVPLAPLADKEIFRRLRATGLTKSQASEAIMNTREIAQRCEGVTLPKVENLRFPLPIGNNDPRILFRDQVNEGWKSRGFNKLSPADRERYIERAKYEMELIEEKDFVDYFLVVGDLVRWAKDLRTEEAPIGIGVGPARGSAAGSLVCYLLRITEVNPMDFPHLIFERFIDRNRHDLPDIDIDFDDRFLSLVFTYLGDTYGADRVGKIATFIRFKGKNSLDDIGRVFDIPADKVEKVKNLLIERVHADLRASATIKDTVEMFDQAAEIVEEHPELLKATLLEGNFKGYSTHAAGILVANGPLTDFCAIYSRPNKDTGEMEEVVSIDKYDAEYMNALKIDALGLITMGTCSIALQYIGGQFQDLYDIDYNDREVLDTFRRGDLTGIFQFEGRAMRLVNTMVLPDNFSEICDINALVRPGPLHSGATSTYCDIKHGRIEAEHHHEIVDQITSHTQYQIVYQEQMLQIVREIGGFTWEESAKIRKMISKKHGEAAFNTMRMKFVDGAEERGVPSVAANKVFDQLATAGAYAFNASHCVSYGMLAYWTQWLKKYHPKAFFAAALAQSDKGTKQTRDKVRFLLRDMDQFDHNVTLGPLDINKAKATWSLGADGAVIPGLRQVHGIGKKSAPVIIEERDKRGGFDGWEDLIEIKGIGKATIQTITDFVESDDPFKLTALTKEIDAWRVRLDAGHKISDGFFESTLPAPTHQAEDIPFEKTSGNVRVVWLGVVKTRNLKDLFEVHYSRTGKELMRADVSSPNKAEWVVMDAEDDTEMVVINAGRFKYAAMRDVIWEINMESDIVLFDGTKLAGQARRAVYVNRMWNLSAMDRATEKETINEK